MKTFLEKFKASLALDRGGKFSSASRSAEAQRFAESLRVMDGDLRKASESEAPPENLHASVMRALRRADTEIVSSTRTALAWRVALGLFVLVAGMEVFWLLNQNGAKATAGLPANEIAPLVAAAIDQGRTLAQAAPQVALEPLAGEMELLNRDFQNAVTFLAASMP